MHVCRCACVNALTTQIHTYVFRYVQLRKCLSACATIRSVYAYIFTSVCVQMCVCVYAFMRENLSLPLFVLPLSKYRAHPLSFTRSLLCSHAHMCMYVNEYEGVGSAYLQKYNLCMYLGFFSVFVTFPVIFSKVRKFSAVEQQGSLCQLPVKPL